MLLLLVVVVRNRVNWTLRKQLDDLNFVDDLALLSPKHEQMQEKASTMADIEKKGLGESQRQDQDDGNECSKS